MVFNPKIRDFDNGVFPIKGEIRATAHPCLNKAVIFEFWKSFTFTASTLTLSQTDELVLCIGNAKKPTLDGHAFAIRVETDGVCVVANTEKDLLQGFMTLLDQIKPTEVDDAIAAEIPCGTIKDTPTLQARMVHLCIFPETQLWEIDRFVRFCGALKYSHVILEFWGMLKYDCMAELSWRHAFTKEQIRPIIRTANDLGVEIIPMFNHWGHASAGRVIHSKHVVLDQNPAMQIYFSEDGWCWDIKKPRVRELLRKIRAELIELCGEGSYFHIGCDEAFNFEFTQENMDFICDFINEISDEMKAIGRRAIAWGDMFLYKHPHYNRNNPYVCNSPSPEAETYLLEHVSHDVVIADWQYDVKESPVETALVFKHAGFDCLLCPWDVGEAPMRACVGTATDEKLFGILHTTWHTLSKGMSYVTMAAAGAYDGKMGARRMYRTFPSPLLRKVAFPNGNYERTGSSKIQVGDVWY